MVYSLACPEGQQRGLDKSDQDGRRTLLKGSEWPGWFGLSQEPCEEYRARSGKDDLGGRRQRVRRIEVAAAKFAVLRIRLGMHADVERQGSKAKQHH